MVYLTLWYVCLKSIDATTESFLYSYLSKQISCLELLWYFRILPFVVPSITPWFTLQIADMLNLIYSSYIFSSPLSYKVNALLLSFHVIGNIDSFQIVSNNIYPYWTSSSPPYFNIFAVLLYIILLLFFRIFICHCLGQKSYIIILLKTIKLNSSQYLQKINTLDFDPHNNLSRTISTNELNLDLKQR